MTPRPDRAEEATPATAGDGEEVAGPSDAEALAEQQAAGVERERRPHPATPLIRGWLILLAALFYIGKEFIPDGSRNGGLPPLTYVAIGLGAVVLLVAAGSFAAWWFTKFVIDAHELRIETGMLNKRSRKVTFERIQSVDLVQPLGARLFQLAELRIEVGGGEPVKIRYIKRTDATRLRDYLLHRAHGEHRDVAATSDADALADRSSTDRILATVNPTQLVLGFLLSFEFLIMFAITATAIIVTAALGVILYALPGLLPAVISFLSMVSNRVITQFNFTLADTGQGLRITRGLTNLTSQSLPVDRIQGLRISQSALWRHKDWYRVEVDVLGYADHGGGENKSTASSLLLPIATREQVEAALGYCLAGADYQHIEMRPISPRARWLRWWNHWTIKYGVNDQLAVNEIGWLVRHREIVPHAKTQSVRIEQGPLQRRIDVASVHIDTTRGPVNWVVPHLPAADARAFAFSQLDRARSARALVGATTTASTEPRESTVEGPPCGAPSDDAYRMVDHDQQPNRN